MIFRLCFVLTELSAIWKYSMIFLIFSSIIVLYHLQYAIVCMTMVLTLAVSSHGSWPRVSNADSANIQRL